MVEVDVGEFSCLNNSYDGVIHEGFQFLNNLDSRSFCFAKISGSRWVG